MFVFPINRVPDETNHARMTWETFHKPTETSFKWMDEIPSNDKVKLAEYKQIFAQKIDMSKEPFQIWCEVLKNNLLYSTVDRDDDWKLD